MSVMGTTAATSVAQSALQAQQAGRERDREDVRSSAEARRLRETIERYRRLLEEGDEFESATQLHVEGELRDEQGAPHQGEQTGTSADQPSPSSHEDEGPAAPLQESHLDVQA